LTDWLVSTDWLLEHLQAPDVAILDASWHLPQTGRDARQEFLAARVPGAQFFDIEELSDTTSLYPHMLPRPEKFASRMRKLGVGDGKKVIVYDAAGIYSAARAWWMFRVFGKDDVAVLDGGLKKWKAEGKPVEDGEPAVPQERHYTARYRSSLVRDRQHVLQALDTGSAQIADARSHPRFTGNEPEPRAGGRLGHMPGAKNVPYSRLVREDGTLKAPQDIEAEFRKAGIDPARPVITTCGSGITAAILSLGLARLGTAEPALYDGSWSEWGSVAELPATTGN
jgi:thiosulfate/3-mercaptopyruvate sulfurtransferase